uniref:Gamma-secretase subunit APH-1 n=1 Tax=Sinocyclocheilus anshuiensis TaxID=1608454 RepID=A0A671MNC1_9TELE
MTLAVFFGCAFIAFGPSFSLFVFTVAKDPLRVIILIAGAFFWLLSLLLSSLVWFIAVKASNSQDLGLQRGLLMFGVFFSVLLQEVFRFVYYRLLRKANEGLAAISDDDGSAISVRQMAYVAGLGFGIMSGAFSMINVLSDSLGPGTVGIFGDSQYYFITAGELLQSLMGHDKMKKKKKYVLKIQTHTHKGKQKVDQKCMQQFLLICKQFIPKSHSEDKQDKTSF